MTPSRRGRPGPRSAELIRLRRALDSLRVPADVLVASQECAEGPGRVPGTAIFDGLNEGRVVARS